MTKRRVAAKDWMLVRVAKATGRRTETLYATKAEAEKAAEQYKNSDRWRNVSVRNVNPWTHR